MNERTGDRGQVSGWRAWVAGARPRTLPAAIVPVALGGASAVAADSPRWWTLVPAAVVSLALQVGVNYANDYSDGVRGTDAARIGPIRLVGSGIMPARRVKGAAFISFSVAGVAGALLAATTSWWLLLVGIAAVLAAWFYTGGPRPYGYAGWGEVFVFVFFGVVATTGTEYVAAGSVSATGVLASVAAGAFACALLVVNNLRDIPGDTVAGKRTLAVRLGDAGTRRFFAVLVIVAAVAIGGSAATSDVWALLGLVGISALRPALRALAGGATGRALVPVLAAVGRAQLVLGLTYAGGLVLALS